MIAINSDHIPVIDDFTAPFELWIKESLARCEKSDFQHIYKEGWAGAVYDMMARMDDWKKQQCKPPVTPEQGYVSCMDGHILCPNPECRTKAIKFEAGATLEIRADEVCAKCGTPIISRQS